MEYYREHGGFTCLNMARRQTLGERCRAIGTLIRPSEVKQLARETSYLARSADLNVASAIGQILSEENLDYYPDIDDEWCSPGVTLRRGGGDCDDHAILAASLFLKLRLHAWVVLGPALGGYHAWVLARHPRLGWLTMEPQTGQIWWGQFAPGYQPEFVLGRDRCARWEQWSLRRFVRPRAHHQNWG